MGFFINNEVLLTENTVTMKQLGEPIKIFCGGQSTTSHKIPRVKVGYGSAK